jgi:hypothetical protein
MLSDELDRLTGTFSADRLFCDALAETHGDSLARLLVYRRWAAAFATSIQEDLHGAVRFHFPELTIEDAGFWTIALTASIHRDISLVPYLALRGVGSDAGLVVRRSLEHAGVLAHLWAVPAKSAFLKDPESGAFKNAFVSESDTTRAGQLKSAGVQKRFEHCYLAAAASQLYRLLSAYTIHGGSPAQLANSVYLPTGHECMFLLRPDPSDEHVGQTLQILGNATELLCVELCSLIRLIAHKYGTASAGSREGVRFVSEVIDPSTGRLVEAIQSTKADLGWA